LLTNILTHLYNITITLNLAIYLPDYDERINFLQRSIHRNME
jgi:hypothetical protein